MSDDTENKPDFEVEGVPLRKPRPDDGSRFAELVAVRPHPNNSVASYHACLPRDEPKELSFAGTAELEAADLGAEILAAAATHSHLLIEVVMDNADLQAVATATRLVNQAAQLFGLRPMGMGDSVGMLYFVRLYTYAEVPMEPEIEAAVDAMLVGHGMNPLPDEDEQSRVLH